MPFSPSSGYPGNSYREETQKNSDLGAARVDVPKLSGAQAGRSESTERYGTEMTLAGMSTPTNKAPGALEASPTNRPTDPIGFKKFLPEL